MAYDLANLKYPLDLQHHSHHHHHHHPSQNMPLYPYPSHHSISSLHRTDENRNENRCDNKEMYQPPAIIQPAETESSGKVDAATMTDPLRIDLRLTSEYFARCSNSLGLPYAYKYEDTNSNSTSTNSFQDVKPKIEYDIEPQMVNGMLLYQCPECAYRFEDRETLHEHLEEHKQRPHICDICGVSLKRKEHLDRHKQGHNKDRPYQCNTCCKAFKRNEHLARHMVTHSGSKNHVCTECGKAFFRKDHLKKHLLSHGSSITNSKSKSPGNSQSGTHQQSTIGQSNNHQQESTFAMMMRQAGPPPFSILRT